MSKVSELQPLKQTKDGSEIARGRDVRDWHKGHTSLRRARAVAFAAVTGQSGLTTFNNLESEAQRRGFLDGFIDATQQTTPNWGSFYEIAQLLKEQTWYWESFGFNTFEDFWLDRVGPAFSQLDELERVYNFAKLASPALFDVDFEQVKGMANESDVTIARLEKVAPAKKHGTNRFTTRQEATDRVAEAIEYAPPSGSSLERRMAVMKRDKPEYAARVLAGEYLVESEDGKTIRIDMNRAEHDAYGMSNAEYQKKLRSEKKKARGRPETVKVSIPLLDKMLNTRSKAMQKKIFDKVVDCKWLMEMINGG